MNRDDISSAHPESGLAAHGPVPWGTHFCRFHAASAERVAILSAYFAAGLRANEACYWPVTDEAEAGQARAAMPEFEPALRSGQLEISAGGSFDSAAVLQAWMERFRGALARGHAGLRVTASAAWPAQAGWPAFLEHERRVKQAFGRSRLVCLCVFCTASMDARDALAAAAAHDFALDTEARVLQSGAARAAREQGLDAEVAQLRLELDERTHELGAAMSAREEFLALLGHELRNPLGPLRNAARVVRMTAAPDPAVAQATDAIDRQVSQISRLVDDLIDLGRLTRGTMSLLKDEVQLDGVIASALDASRPQMEGRGQELAVSLAAESIVVRADAVRLAQAFSNLLDNASTYTPRGGRIWLSAAYEDAAAVVRIRDNGVGIPPHMLSRIFALFVQGPRRPERSESGLGIGLAVVKRVVDLHGGSVQAFSEGEGRGSEFVVRLPAVSKSTRAIAEDARANAKPARPPLRVLVVDDHLDSNEMLAQLLTLHGHEVRRVTNGPAALESAREFAPDAVLLDIGLPGMDGYEVARELRQLDATRASTLVAITGYGSSRDLHESSQAGIDRHMVKPVDPEALLALLDALTPRAVSGDGKVLSIGARLRRAFKRS